MEQSAGEMEVGCPYRLGNAAHYPSSEVCRGSEDAARTVISGRCVHVFVWVREAFPFPDSL